MERREFLKGLGILGAAVAIPWALVTDPPVMSTWLVDGDLVSGTKLGSGILTDKQVMIFVKKLIEAPTLLKVLPVTVRFDTSLAEVRKLRFMR